MKESSVYEYEINLEDKNSTVVKQLDFIGFDKKVLEFGCSTGYVSKILKERGCAVTGIEIDEEAAKTAEAYCERVIVGDIETIDYNKQLSNEKFDVALFGDILEHLKNPKTILLKVKDFLKEKGYIVTSIPNVAHWSTRLDLMCGKFDYQELGILDDTHLRFFTKKTITNLLESCGYYESSMDLVRQDVDWVKVSTVMRLKGLNDADIKNFSSILNDSEAVVFQYVIKAVPSAEPEYLKKISAEKISLEDRILKLEEQITNIYGQLKEKEQQTNELNVAVHGKDAQIRDLDRQIADISGQLIDKEQQINELNVAVQGRDAQIRNLEAQIADISSQINDKERQINELNAAVQDKDAQIRNLEVQIADISGYLKEKEQQIDELNAAVQDKDELIWYLKEQITDISGHLKEKDKQIDELDITIHEKDEQIRDLEEQITEFSGHLKEQERRINELSVAVQGKDEQILNLDEQIANISGQLKEREERLGAIEIENLRINSELNSVKSSITWRTVMKWHLFVEKVMPQATKRRRWYDRSIIGLRTIANEGWRSFWWKFRVYRRTYKISTKNVKNQKLELSENNSIEKQYRDELFNKASQRSPEYVPLSKNFINLTEDDIKLIAFYLPQFHPIPENDKWWGKGFTEWTNVTKAVPQFIGHYQPHLPDELGFYDLRLVAVQKRQIELAKQYGIYGFCFHYYWFNGKMLLEKPLNQFIQNPEMDFPFCVCWANENWTRRWDGLENDILIAQKHSPESDFAFIKDLEHIFRDPRYIRINGKPLLVVYRVSLLPDANGTANRWREYCKQRGIEDLYLVAAQSLDIIDPREYGFDAAVEFPPHTMYGCCERIDYKLKLLNPNFSGHILDYENFVKNKYYLKTVPYKQFKGITPSWDNTARRPNAPTIYFGSNPELYKEWLSDIVNFTRKTHSKEEQMVFINAWNEWSEGTHLEPDKYYGYGYLQATSEVVLDYRKKERECKNIIFVSHDAHLHGAQMIALNIVKLLTEQFHYKVHLILKSGGCLEKEFKNYSTLYNLERDYADKRAVEKLVDNLYRQGANIAICNTVVSGDLVKIFTKKNVKTISLIHELPELIKQFKMEKNAEFISQFADKVIFPSEFVKTKFATISKLDDNDCIIAPQGLFLKNRFKNKKEEARILLRNMLSIPQDTKIILGVGYADYRKGVDLFVQVAKKVVKVDPKTYFVWVGHQDGNIMNKINSDIKKSGIKDNILFVGIKKEEIDVFFAGADLYVLTSREDPFPSVVLEAMDVEVPVIGFNDAGGFKDIVTDSTGILVPYLDVDEMSEKVIHLLHNVNLREEIGKNASELINEKYKFVDYVYLLLKLLGQEYKKVSVVLPNYNYEHYLKERMQSIINQEYPIYEIIFLDDCSSDNSIDVIKDFANNCAITVKLISNDSNSGSVFRQWAKGIANAGGDYIWITEADDFCESSFLYEVMYGFNDEQVVLSYSQSKQMDQNGNFIANDYLKYTKDIDEYKWKKDYSREGIQEICDALVIKNTIPNVSGVVFKKCDISEILNELVEFKVAGDWFFYVWLLQKGKISYTAKSLNFHRRHDKGVTLSENAQKHYNEIVRMQDYIIENFDIDDDTLKKVSNYREYVRGYLLGPIDTIGIAAKTQGLIVNTIGEIPNMYKAKYGDDFIFDIDERNDGMYQFLVNHPSVRDPIAEYFRGGELMLISLQEIFENIGNSFNQIDTFLDFASGHGRFTRFLIQKLSREKVIVSDIDKNAVDFCKKTFGVNGFYSVENPDRLIHDNKYDVIYVASLFSHLSLQLWNGWLKRLYNMLNESGILIFSTHGMYCYSLVDDEVTNHLFGEGVVEKVEEGFLYKPILTSPSKDYGTTFVTCDYVKKVIRQNDIGKIIAFYPQKLWDFQDLYVIQKEITKASPITKTG